MKNRKKIKGLEDIPLMVKAEMALKEAVADAIAEHKRMGHPIVVWRDGKVVTIPPEEIAVPVPKAGHMNDDISPGTLNSVMKRAGIKEVK
jgi:predicted RNA binding protein YcfA (HicA-like mRNA interferase family)